MAKQMADGGSRDDSGARSGWDDATDRRDGELGNTGLLIRCYLALLVILTVAAALAMRS